MKKHKDLLTIIKSKGMRITPLRSHLIQFVLDNSHRQTTLDEITGYLGEKIQNPDRTTIYRNIELLKNLDIIQELNLRGHGKRFQYVFEGRVHHFFICKACGKLNQGNKALFDQIEKAFREIHDFQKNNMSAVFYGVCKKCKASAN